MYIAHNDIIESQGILLSILHDKENDVLETYTSPLSLKQGREDNVTLLKLSGGEFAVCDKWQEGVYVTYIFIKEDEAKDCFDDLVVNCKIIDDSCESDETLT